MVAWGMVPRYQPRRDGARWAVVHAPTGRVVVRYRTERAALAMARGLNRAISAKRKEKGWRL